MNETTETVRFLAIQRTLSGAADAQCLFAALADHGRARGTVLLQSSDNIPKYGERSLAAVGSSLMLTGREETVRLVALDGRGRCLLPVLEQRLASVVSNLQRAADAGGAPMLTGRISPDLRSVSGRERPFRRNAMDVIRALAFCSSPEENAIVPSHGLFGAFGYTFVHQYESFERNPRDALGDWDYCFFLATRMFIIDHAAGSTHVVSSVPLVPGVDLAPLRVEAEEDVRRMAALAGPASTVTRGAWSAGAFQSDTSRDTYLANVEAIQRDIHAGRAFQVVYGRTLSADFTGSPFDVYGRLSEVNPSPYMFYFNDGDGVLLAASPEMAVRVSPEPAGRRVELRPIAGTKPRGRRNGAVHPLTDAKYETALKIDPKELAEHTMLVDLARNDLSSICKPGTTQVDEPFVVEKYSHVQHLVSNVSGILADHLDALHAYLGTMNMGTVTGAPKLEAMKMINRLEASSRGYFAGGVGYVFPDGRMDTALVIRAIRFKHNKAHIRAAAGIVADSIPQTEWAETESKAAASLRVLRGDPA
ncbi:MAG: anthranilate synthase component I family protein [Phycisphaerales bacterium]|nr:anthranilate synthase component I family protein [Phycisphaerales bacterium]